MDQASLRVMRWRYEGLLPRLAQALLISVLLWLQTRGLLAFGWLALVAATSLVDAHLSRRVVAQQDNRRLAAINDLSRTLSAAIFASVCFVMLADHSGFGLAAPMLAACAINLNNAMMTAGVRRFIFSLTTPSSIVLVSLPLAAWATDHPLSLTGAIVMTVGAAAYVVFIVRLAGALFSEGEALRAALEAAEAASRAKSTFLAVTSHEIRTPLNGVLGMAQAMENEDLSPVQRDRVGVIRKSGEALLELLNDILDLSKIEAAKLELETAPFDLEAVSHSAVGAFSATARNKGIALELAFAPEARGFFDGDAARIRQVLCNLISNAVKFTEAGGVYVEVVVASSGIRLCVQDTGPGVPPGFAERMFEKFTQADSSMTRRFGGTGLGLAISRELSEAMGGSITVANPPEGGARFVVELPLSRSSGTVPQPAPGLSPKAVTASAGLRILAAEDNAINQLVLRTLLDQIGVESVIVDGGAEAIEAWESDDFDLVLMDVQMPGMDGPTATRVIRAAEAATGRRRTPIVALTANVMSHQLEDYADAGMDAFVSKPIAVTDLYSTIAQWANGETEAAESAPLEGQVA